VKSQAQHFFVGFLNDIFFEFISRNAFLPDLNLVFIQQVTAFWDPAPGCTGAQHKEDEDDKEKYSFGIIYAEKENSIHRESGLNILLTTGFRVQDYFVPSHKDNFISHKFDAFLNKIDFWLI